MTGDAGVDPADREAAAEGDVAADPVDRDAAADGDPSADAAEGDAAADTTDRAAAADGDAAAEPGDGEAADDAADRDAAADPGAAPSEPGAGADVDVPAEAETGVSTGVDAGESPVLLLEDVDAFYGNSHVLFDLSLELYENEVVTLLGRNGAGKTTTLRTITGTVPRREGRIEYEGEDISDLSIDAISKRGVKIVPEDRRVFPTLTVMENLQVASDLAANPREIEEMFEIFPVLDDLRQNRGRNLSGGEQQMLSVARALVQNPDLLLLDEPTEGLAPVIVEDLREVLGDVVERDVTVLMTEQNVEFALALGERSYIIDRGSNVWEGSAEDLQARDDLMDEYLSVGAQE